MEIIDRVLTELERQGLKMAGLCQHLGIGTSTMANWKTRHTDPPAKYVAPICEYLNVSTYYLLTGKTDREKIVSGLAEDEQKVLKYYGDLTEEQRDYIKGEMARMSMENKRDTELSNAKAT